MVNFSHEWLSGRYVTVDLLQEVPPGKYALISVRQPKGQLINIRSQSALYARANQQPTMGRQFKVRTLKH